MSKISDQVRAYVNDPDVSEHYGAWGALRPDQRRLIRNLCDVCDMYEKTADLAVAEREANVKGFIEQVEALSREIKALRAFKEYWDELYGQGLAVAGWHENGAYEDFDNFYDCAEMEYDKQYDAHTNTPTKVSSGDICVVCGEHVPEGRQICSMCEVGQEFLEKTYPKCYGRCWDCKCTCGCEVGGDCEKNTKKG